MNLRRNSHNATFNGSCIISLMAAMAENRVIGRDNTLPWHMPADLKRFKQLTTGHTVIMGRRTWQSMNGPLPKRRNIVVTRQANFEAHGAEVTHSLDAAIDLAQVREAAEEPEEIFILGGEQIYRLALPLADRIYLTLIHAVFEGDTCFPQFHGEQWELVEQEHHQADDRNPHPYSFLTYERRG